LFNPITMQQRQELDQAQKKPRAGSRWILAAVVLVGAVVLAQPLVSTGYRVYAAIVRDQYELYRAKVEQSTLQAANARMRSELIALRSKRTQQSEGREGALTQKISELESLIENVTALGIFRDHGKRSPSARVVKSQQTGAGRGELAAILESPQLAGTSSQDRTPERDGGVGGAEEPCDGHVGDEDAHNEGLVSESESSIEDCENSRQEPRSEVQQALVSRINRFISVLRFLPIGTPVQGSFTSGFGHRRSPFSHRTSFHYGIDISLKVGSQIRSTGAGRVVKVEHDGTYGIMVDVQHGSNLITRYAHLSKALVKEGQEVHRGMIIALSGNTGRSTGPHLHYEVRHNGQPRNPAPFVQLAGRLSEFVTTDGRII
jgi:murein DD-endopeptidase MepM/ murein hydrolase activator NlpD